MAEWNAISHQWIKHTGPVIDGANEWEKIHFVKPDGSLVPYSMIGDQAVIYVPGVGAEPGAWHLYYQAVTDSPVLRVITVHAVSSDGVTWPAGNRSVMATHSPFPSAILPGGPYSMDVSMINGKFYFVGWIPNEADLSKQGLWLVSSTTPDGSAPGDFTNWLPLLYDNNGTWWHAADPGVLATHEAGLFAPTLALENGTLWLYYSGVRKDGDGLWTSIGRAVVDPNVLH
jgi:hypothetical protein